MSQDAHHVALAKQALAKIGLGRDPLTSVLEAIKAALVPDQPVPQQYEHLGERQREIALAMVGEGWVTNTAMIQRFGRSKYSVQESMRGLMNNGLIERHPKSRGLYRLKESIVPKIHSRAGSLAGGHNLVDFVRRNGSVTIGLVADFFGVTKPCAWRRLRRLVRKGQLQHVDRGYRLPDQRAA